MSQRRTFDRAFKERAVELSYQRDNIKELADELGVGPELIYRWRREFKEYKKGSFPGRGKPKLTEEQEELIALRKALKEAELARDILKKAIGIFSRRDGKSSNL
jgi:transposase